MHGPTEGVRPRVLSTQWVRLMSRKEAGVLKGEGDGGHQERKGWVKFNGSETVAEESIFLSASCLRFCFLRESGKPRRINERRSTTKHPPREISQPFVFEIICASKWSFVLLCLFLFWESSRSRETQLVRSKVFPVRPADPLKQSDIND